MDAERTLTERELNRALLARQLLLERAELPLPEALERVAGLQAQYAPSMYVALWSRLADFERDSLTRALERRTVVQATLMRSTIHLVSAEDYWPLTTAVREARRRQWLRGPGRALADVYPKAASAIARALKAGPRPRSELEPLTGDGVNLIGASLWLDAVRVPPSGTWERRRADIFALAENWIGALPEIEPDAAIAHLVSRYLAGFGPASRKEIQSFTGLQVRELTPALERLELRRFRSEGGDELLDLPDAPLPDAGTPAPVRYLPVWEAMLLVHARRSGVLREEHRPIIFNTKTPHSHNTFLVDGHVAGTWRFEKGSVRVEPFGRLSREVRRELAEEGERLAEFHS